ncbi:MAG: hypothetical protein AAF363_03070 [Bacteroidota bacterium]
MEQEKAFSLLNRQLTDILASADRIINGDDSSEEIESFSKYSLELKRFVNERIENPVFREAMNEIPDIDYRRTQIQLWQFLILPVWWVNIYKDYQARKKTQGEVKLVQSKYSSLQFLLKSLSN